MCVSALTQQMRTYTQVRASKREEEEAFPDQENVSRGPLATMLRKEREEEEKKIRESFCFLLPVDGK